MQLGRHAALRVVAGGGEAQVPARRALPSSRDEAFSLAGVTVRSSTCVAEPFAYPTAQRERVSRAIPGATPQHDGPSARRNRGCCSHARGAGTPFADAGRDGQCRLSVGPWCATRDISLDDSAENIGTVEHGGEPTNHDQPLHASQRDK